MPSWDVGAIAGRGVTEVLVRMWSGAVGVSSVIDVEDSDQV